MTHKQIMLIHNTHAPWHKKGKKGNYISSGALLHQSRKGGHTQSLNITTHAHLEGAVPDEGDDTVVLAGCTACQRAGTYSVVRANGRGQGALVCCP